MNRYFDPSAGENVWDYFFAPIGHNEGAASIRQHRARVFVTVPGGGAEHWRVADSVVHDNEHPHARALPNSNMGVRRSRVRRRAHLSRLLRAFLRPNPMVSTEAYQRLSPWRQDARPVLGVALASRPTLAQGARRREATHKHVDDFVRAHGAHSLVVIVGASAAELAGFRRRHGDRRVRGPTEGAEPCPAETDVAPVPERRSGSGQCAGLEELLEALMLAHCDYILNEGHSAAEFAMWWNARLQEAHLDLDLDDAAGEGSQGMRPWWAGGSWQPPPTQEAHARAMLAALAQLANRTQASVDGVEGGTWAGAAMQEVAPMSMFVPGLPRRTPRGARQRRKPWALISHGRCSADGGRIMRHSECEAYALEDKKHFLGSSTDRTEYPGCTLWADTQLVEFNDHADERTGCNIAPRGSCVCQQQERPHK